MEFWSVVVLVAVAFVWDACKRKIPNMLTAPATVVGLIESVLPGGRSPFTAAAGFAIGLSAGLLLYLIKAIGAGDAKLFAAVGVLTDSGFTLDVILFSIVIGGLYGFILVIRRMADLELSTVLYSILMFRYAGLPDRQLLSAGKRTVIPFMYAVVPAVAIVCGRGG